MATVLIIGASRGIGLESVKYALEAGHSVRALARSAQRMPVHHQNLTKVSADALDQAAVKSALEGVDAVIQTLGVTPSLDSAVKPVSLFSDATRVLIQAMKQTGVKRLITVTGFGAGDSRNQGGCLYNTAFHLFLGRVYEIRIDRGGWREDRLVDRPALPPLLRLRSRDRPIYRDRSGRTPNRGSGDGLGPRRIRRTGPDSRAQTRTLSR